MGVSCVPVQSLTGACEHVKKPSGFSGSSVSSGSVVCCRFSGYGHPIKRPYQMAISESDLRKRICPARADRGTTGGADRRVGAGIGPSQGAIPPGCPGRLVAIERFLLASPRRLRAPVLGALPGGQPATKGTAARGYRSNKWINFIPVKPSRCPGCGHSLTGDDPSAAPPGGRPAAAAGRCCPTRSQAMAQMKSSSSRAPAGQTLFFGIPRPVRRR